MAALGLICIKIDCCPGGCMLFHNVDVDKSVTIWRNYKKDWYEIINKKGVEKKIDTRFCDTLAMNMFATY